MRTLVGLVSLGFLLFGFPALSQTALKVTPSTLPTGEDPGFRCAFSRVGEKKRDTWILFADDYILLPRRALITVNGRSVMLAPTGLTLDGKDRPPKVGDRLNMSFEGEGIRVTVAAKVTWACPPKNDSCEVTRYRAKIVAVSGDASAAIDAQGECGS